jgi:hypothetical protein
LIAGGLHHRRRSVQFIKKDDAGAISRQEARDSPLRPSSFAEERQTSEIDWIEEKGTDIPQFETDRPCDLANNGGLADARSTPKEYRLTRSDHGPQRRCYDGCLHENLSLCVYGW